jgi:hypothetical protein
MRILFLLATAAAVRADGIDSIPFAHLKHAPLKMKCVACHKTAEAEEAATFPAVSQCRVCHTSIADREIPSQRIYRVRDFVVFSHARHATAKVGCASCHGDVNAQMVLKVERPTTMAACVGCHKEHKATVACNACHELGQ